MICTVIESPYRGDIERNRVYAQAALLDSLRRGEAPFASHLLYPQVLQNESDPNQREQGMSAGYAWLLNCDRIAFYTDLGWSGGMLHSLHNYVLKLNFDFRLRSLSGKPQIPATLDEDIEHYLRSHIETENPQ